MRNHLICSFVVALATLIMTSPKAAEAVGATPEAISSAASAAERSAQSAAKSASAAAASASSAASAGENAWAPPGRAFLYGVPLVVLVGTLFAILSIRAALGPSKWSIADALSEEVSMPACTEVTDAAGIKTRTVTLDKTGQPLLVPEMRASSSRVIAFMGMIAILFMFIGFGAFALFSFGSNGQVPSSIDRVVSFLLSGLTLFAPYMVNKFASVFKGMTGGK